MITRRNFLAKSAIAAGAATAGIVATSDLLRAQNATPSNSDSNLTPAQPDVDYRPVVTPNNPQLPWLIIDGVTVFRLVAVKVAHRFAPGLKA